MGGLRERNGQNFSVWTQQRCVNNKVSWYVIRNVLFCRDTPRSTCLSGRSKPSFKAHALDHWSKKATMANLLLSNCRYWDYLPPMCAWCLNDSTTTYDLSTTPTRPSNLKASSRATRSTLTFQGTQLMARSRTQRAAFVDYWTGIRILSASVSISLHQVMILLFTIKLVYDRQLLWISVVIKVTVVLYFWSIWHSYIL